LAPRLAARGAGGITRSRLDHRIAPSANSGQGRRNNSVPSSFQQGKPVWCAGPEPESPPMWVLLLLPFVGLLWVPFYNFQEPALFGFPFFYWYQLAWVPISSLLIWLVYRRRTPDEAP
jgi:hypothetical protein